VTGASQKPRAIDHRDPEPATGNDTYIVRTRIPPDIVCPSWCTTGPRQHIGELSAHDGGVVHRGDLRSLGPSSCMTIRPFAASLVDGSVDPDDPGVHLDLTRDGDGPISLTRRWPSPKSSRPSCVNSPSPARRSIPLTPLRRRLRVPRVRVSPFFNLPEAGATPPAFARTTSKRRAGDLLPFAHLDALALLR
jgi:hypothetical protein